MANSVNGQEMMEVANSSIINVVGILRSAYHGWYVVDELHSRVLTITELV